MLSQIAHGGIAMYHLQSAHPMGKPATLKRIPSGSSRPRAQQATTICPAALGGPNFCGGATAAQKPAKQSLYKLSRHKDNETNRGALINQLAEHLSTCITLNSTTMDASLALLEPDSVHIQISLGRDILCRVGAACRGLPPTMDSAVARAPRNKTSYGISTQRRRLSGISSHILLPLHAPVAAGWRSGMGSGHLRPCPG